MRSGSKLNTRALALAILLGAACASTTARKTETAIAKVLISTEQENQIGLQVKNELEQKQQIRYLGDAEIVSYVRGVAGRVIDQGRRDRGDVQWQVNVIDDPKTVNAFATPGGYLYVFSGLLLAAENEAQLAGVMAHETGHVVARHSARSMVAAFGLEAVVALATGQNPGLLAQIATTIAANGLMLKHSRDDETEADELGVRYMSAAGYDPHALAAFFGVLKAKEGSMPGVLVFMSDHPATGDRIAHIERQIAQQRLGGAERNEARYLAMRSRVAAYRPSAGGPPPPPPPPGPPAPPSAAPRAPSGAAPPPPPPPPPPPR